jgi:hypothetical protein
VNCSEARLGDPVRTLLRDGGESLDYDNGGGGYREKVMDSKAIWEV